MEYVIVIHPAEEGGYWSEVPTLEGCFAQAETLEDLLTATREAISAHIEALRVDGQDIPKSNDVIVATVHVGEASAA